MFLANIARKTHVGRCTMQNREYYGYTCQRLLGEVWPDPRQEKKAKHTAMKLKTLDA